MGDLLHDLRYSGRMLRKRTGTVTLAVLALGFGIGLTTTMFSIVQGAILRGLPFEESDRLMGLARLHVSRGARESAVPLHDFADWRKAQHSFEDLAAFNGSQVSVAGGGGLPERYRAAYLTPNTLRVLRVHPIQGRDFADADAHYPAGSPAVALISYRLWQTRFDASPSAIGSVLTIDRRPTEIVGVMPPRFGFPQTGEIWLPLSDELPAARGDGPSVRVMGRLAPGVGVAQANVEMAGIARQLEQSYPENKDISVSVEPFIVQNIGRQVVDTLFTMLAAVFGVLLIASVNVTNLQLARAAERVKEVALRTALGASRWRILRQLLIEGALISAAGAALGVGIARTGIALFNGGIADTTPPFWIDIRIDRTVVLFVIGLTVFVTLVSTLLPAWRVARENTNDVLKDEGRASTGLRMGRFSRGLVIIEVFLSCALLMVSGLMVRSILTTSRQQFPFATADVFVAEVVADVPDAQLPATIDRLETRLAAVPGVQAFAFSSGLPDRGTSHYLTVEGASYAENEQPTVLRLAVTPGFFGVLRVKPRAGRLIERGDRHGTLPVAVVGQDFADTYFPRTDAIGKRIRLGRDPKGPWWTVVGIVPSLSATQDPQESVQIAYVPLAQAPQAGLTVLASTPGDPLTLATPMRSAVIQVDPTLPLSDATSLARYFWQRGWAFRVFGGLFLTFGLAALLLAGAGLYGVMAFSVRRRTQEIGVRMALGASRGTVVRMVLWQGMWRVTLGVVLGLAPGWFVGTQMVALRAGSSGLDPVATALAVSTLLAAGLAASLVPAMRAAAVDPLTALRHE